MSLFDQTLEKMTLNNDTGAAYENVRLDRHSDLFCFLSDFDSNADHKPVIDAHYHLYIELIYVVAGTVGIAIGEEKFNAVAGDLWIILPGETHSFERKKGTKYFCIQIDPAFLFNGTVTSSEATQYMTYRHAIPAASHRLSAADIDHTEIPKSIQQIALLYMEGGKFHRLKIRGELTTIAIFVLERWEEEYFNHTEESEEEQRIKRLAPVIDLIKREYKTTPKGEDMAKLLGMSSSYFSRYFSNTIGMRFNDYVNYLKINEGERLLVTSNHTIEQIAHEVGFSNPSYFITLFKKQFSVSPKKYRSHYGKK